MERKPVIGVIPLYDDEKESMWMLPGYFDGISASGAIPVMLPLNAGKMSLFSLINLLTAIFLPEDMT